MTALDVGRRETVTDALDAFLATDEPLESTQHAVDLLCILRSVVARSGITGFPTYPSDCFCGDRAMRDGFQNAGREVRFIAKATLGLLGALPEREAGE